MLQLKNVLKNNKYWRNEDGLTMLELLTTIAILGIITAIASPVIISMIQQAQIDAYKGEMTYVADSTYKMINGTLGQPELASGSITSDGNTVTLESLGPRINDSGATLATNVNGYWYDISTMSLPFDAQDASALITWDNSRIVRVVPVQADGSIVTDTSTQTIADACITAWVGDRNLVIESVKTTTVTEDDIAPCGLIPGPIEEPEAPSAPQSLEPEGDEVTSEMVASLISPPDNLGSDSDNIAIESYRVTCTDLTNGGTVTATSATSTVDMAGFTRGADYSCTAAITTNAYPGFSPESGASATVRIPEAPGAPTSLAGTGSGGQVSLTWTTPADDGCNEAGVDDGNSCGTGYAINNYEVQYIVGVEGTAPSAVTDADFNSADIIAAPNANTTYALSNSNINDYNTTNGTSLTQLVDGNTYYIRARAVSSVGVEGAWSDPIVEQTATEPDAIDDATGTDGTNQISIEFSVPYDGGLPIDKFEIWYDINDTYDGGGTTYTGPDGDGTPLGRSIVVCDDSTDPNYVAVVCSKNEDESVNVVIDQLPDSTSYFVKIFTENDMGMSAWSDDVAVATYAPAEAPEATDATIDDSGNATVTWQ